MRRMYSEKQIATAKKNIDTLVDADGNPRFVEGSGVLLSTIPEGVEITYNKWSLSGSHLMIILSGTIEKETIVPNNANWVNYNLPKFIMDKIIAVWGGAYIDSKTLQLKAGDWSVQNLSTTIAKYQDDILTFVIVGGGSLTLNAKRNFRIQYDLLIDAEQAGE